MEKKLKGSPALLAELMKSELGLTDRVAQVMAEDPTGLGLVICEQQKIEKKASREKLIVFIETAEKSGFLSKGKDSDWVLRRAFELPGGGVVGGGED